MAPLTMAIENRITQIANQYAMSRSQAIEDCILELLLLIDIQPQKDKLHEAFDMMKVDGYRIEILYNPNLNTIDVRNEETLIRLFRYEQLLYMRKVLSRYIIEN